MFLIGFGTRRMIGGLLSRCDSFMCSGQCNGWDVVNDFNEGRFERSYKFRVGAKE